MPFTTEASAFSATELPLILNRGLPENHIAPQERRKASGSRQIAGLCFTQLH